MMTYITEKPVTQLVNQERSLITIEFAPKVNQEESEYTYQHPKFVFGDKLELKFTYPSIAYTVCALEIIESKTPSGRLLSQPRWKYKITNNKESFWKEESALIRYGKRATCATCPHFDNYNEPTGRGWCNLFNHQAKSNHIKTNDCILNSPEAFPTEEITDPADLPRSEYQIGSIVKVIDKDEHHSEWAVFEVVECHHNPERYRTFESYLSETDWYYTISSTDGITRLFVSEIQICDADMSWNISTEDIF